MQPEVAAVTSELYIFTVGEEEQGDQGRGVTQQRTLQQCKGGLDRALSTEGAKKAWVVRESTCDILV